LHFPVILREQLHRDRRIILAPIIKMLRALPLGRSAQDDPSAAMNLRLQDDSQLSNSATIIHARRDRPGCGAFAWTISAEFLF
jgi:hypothetical protein